MRQELHHSECELSCFLMLSIFCSQFISCAYCRRPPKAQFNWILRSEFPCETKVGTSLEAKNVALQHPLADTIGPRRMTLKNEQHARLDTAQRPLSNTLTSLTRRSRASPERLRSLHVAENCFPNFNVKIPRKRLWDVAKRLKSLRNCKLLFAGFEWEGEH